MDATTVALIEMLERRVRTAQEANDEIRDRLAEDARAAVPAMSAEKTAAERRDYRCASARWTEAQEALAEARKLAGHR